MNFIRRLNRGNFYFSSQSFKIWWIINGIEVRRTHKISAQYLAKKQWDMWCEYHYNYGTV